MRDTYSIGYVLPMTKNTDTLKRGDRAMFGTDSPEAVTIVRAETIGPARWLHVQRADGGRFVTHPSHLTKIHPLADVLAAHPVRTAA